jgi:penicillin amidase
MLQSIRYKEGEVSKRMRRLVISFSTILVIALILTGVSLYFIRRSFPKTDGTLQVSGLQDQVEIFRDNMGVPHIYASNQHDLFFAQGYVHAQDRFWQMEFSRRVGSGRLSEILGEGALEQDRFIRTVGWHRTAAQELELLDPLEQSILNAYSQGVNAYIHENKGKLGLEFTLLSLTGVTYEPEPWSPLNTITWGKVMAWDLGGNRSAELTRAHIAARLGLRAVDELMPRYADDHPTIVTSTLNDATLTSIPEALFALNTLGSGPGLGSNNWVIAGARTASGQPILADDTHLGIQMPSIWYENGLHCTPMGPECPFNVVGFSFAGVPAVVIGHNDRIGWGVTNLGPDVQDLFIERINPQDPNQYEFQGQYVDMEIIREEIQVAGLDEPEVVFVRETRHGPIINDILGGIEEDWSYGWQPLSFSWTALEPGTIWKSVFLMNKAQNWDEFRSALSYWDVPSQNFVYADVDGNIGYQTPGRIPIRASGNGTMPSPGWTGTHEWVNYIPFDELPTAFNPPDGYIVTANNAVVDDDYRYFLSADWAPGYRARRIVEMIDGLESITLEDIPPMHGDPQLLYAVDVLPYILAVQPNDAIHAQLLDLLRSWDGYAWRDSVPAMIFEAMRVHLVTRTFGDELGEQLLDRSRSDLLIALNNILPITDSEWFDDIFTEEVETRDQIILLALEDTVEELTEKLGKNINDWNWGSLHTATFENQSLGQSGIGLIEWLLNRGPVAVDGSSGAPNATSYSFSDPYTVTSVPSQRQILDFQYFEQSLSMHTTGQSGHPFHPHYDDMIDPWRNIEYHPMLWTRGQVEAAVVDYLILTP